MDISIMIEGQMGLNWPRWKGIVEAVEQLGFAGLFRSDHFTNASQPDQDSLEMIVSLTYLAEHTTRIHFGPLVAPASFRDPVMYARQAAALGDLSNGRMIAGFGAGWQEREHEMFGYDLGDVDTRFARFEEALEVGTRLLRNEEPVSFAGRCFNLRDAKVRPRGPVRILVGGNGARRTLPLAARFADVWNGIFLGPDAFKQKCALLDELLATEGRKPSELKRTMMSGIYLDRDDESLRARGALAGSLDQITSQIDALEQAGAQELMLQWFALDDLDGLERLARALL